MTQVTYDGSKFLARKVEDTKVESAKTVDVYGVDTLPLMHLLTEHPNEWYTLGNEYKVR